MNLYAPNLQENFANDTLRLKSGMSKEEIAASEKAKWQQIKALISGLNITNSPK